MMNNKTPTEEQPAEPAENKKGFLVRMIERIDHAMKETAEKKAKQGCCGTDKNGKPCC
jgi:hypothetical protein